MSAKNWMGAAASYSNLSLLELTLGGLTDALADARRSISHADQSGDAFRRMVGRAMTADALHQSGRRAEADSLFAEAERMQEEMQPQFDMLYSLQGFSYCDWFLAPAECAAWQALVHGTGSLSVTDTNGEDGPAKICDEVERRATTTLKWVTDGGGSLLTIALDHLTLARVGLIRAMLSHGLPQPRSACRTSPPPSTAYATRAL